MTIQKKSVKVTKRNFESANNEGIEGRPLKIRFFNILLDDFVTLWNAFIAMGTELLTYIPSTATMLMNTITEYTSGSGVTIEGVKIQDGKVGATNSITANSTGGGAAIVSSLEQYIIITATNVDHIISLPLLSNVPTGTMIRGTLLNTGCELRVHPTDQVATKYINGVTGGNELKMNNGTGCAYFEAIKKRYDRWIVKTWTSLGGAVTIVPDK